MNIYNEIAKHFEYAGCREFRQSEDHFDAIETMEECLLAGDYNPYKPDNALESINNSKDIHFAAWLKAVQDGEALIALELARVILEPYWQERAAEDAPAALEKYRAKQAEYRDRRVA